MKNFKTICPEAVLRKENQREGDRGALVTLRIGEVEKPVVYVGNREDADFAVLEGSREEAERFFDTLWEEGLSPLHLADAVKDYNFAEKCENL